MNKNAAFILLKSNISILHVCWLATLGNASVIKFNYVIQSQQVLLCTTLRAKCEKSALYSIQPRKEFKKTGHMDTNYKTKVTVSLQ